MEEKMSEKEEREAVVKEALTWLNTPYHHEARVKGAGVDCGMLVAEVFERTGLIIHVDVEHYNFDWHMHRSAEVYLSHMTKYMKRVERQPLPGDVVLFKYGRCISHGGIVIKWPQIIHAYFSAKSVVLDDASKGELKARFAGTYSYWR